MDRKILNIAYIGNGKSTNRYHAPFVLARPNLFKISKIYARHIDHSTWKAIPGVIYTDALEEILSDPAIDVIEIVTPPTTHFELARQALAAGKHVVIDTPICASEAEGRELFELARKHNVTVQCYQNRRFDSDFLTAQKVLASGKLGHVHEIVTSYDYWRPHMMDGAPFSPIDNAAFGHGSHCIDQLISWLGIPESWHPELRQLSDPDTAVDYFDIDLYYPGRGLKATARANYRMAFTRPSFEIYGDRGAYIKWGKDNQERDLKHFYLPAGHSDFGLDDPRDWGTLRYEDNHGLHEERIPSVRSSYSQFYDALHDTVANGAAQLVKPEETLAQLRILEDGLARLEA